MRGTFICHVFFQEKDGNIFVDPSPYTINILIAYDEILSRGIVCIPSGPSVPLRALGSVHAQCCVPGHLFFLKL